MTKNTGATPRTTTAEKSILFRTIDHNLIVIKAGNHTTSQWIVVYLII